MKLIDHYVDFVWQAIHSSTAETVQKVLLTLAFVYVGMQAIKALL